MNIGCSADGTEKFCYNRELMLHDLRIWHTISVWSPVFCICTSRCTQNCIVSTYHIYDSVWFLR